MTRLRRLTFGLLAPLLMLVVAWGAVGCKSSRSRDEDVERRIEWIASQTAAEKAWGRDFLTRAGDSHYHDVIFYDGWFAPEHDKKTGNAWRWAQKHSVLRLRTKTNGSSVAYDMELTLIGYVPHEHMNARQLRLEFAVNGHVLHRWDPPEEGFEHVVFVPKWLLEHSDWVDFSITVANVVVPPGDWRELGVATTGLKWTPVQAN